jgi:hypothetical protein
LQGGDLSYLLGSASTSEICTDKARKFFLVVDANEMVNGSAPIQVIEYIRGTVIQVCREIEVHFVGELNGSLMSEFALLIQVCPDFSISERRDQNP